MNCPVFVLTVHVRGTCVRSCQPVIYCTVGGVTPGGVLEVYMTGGSDVFFWVENLHAQYFFGSYLRMDFSFWVFVAISGPEKYSFELLFSDVYSEKTVNIKKTIQ